MGSFLARNAAAVDFRLFAMHPESQNDTRTGSSGLRTFAFWSVLAGTVALGTWHVVALSDPRDRLESGRAILSFLAFLLLVYLIHRERR